MNYQTPLDCLLSITRLIIIVLLEIYLLLLLAVVFVVVVAFKLNIETVQPSFEFIKKTRIASERSKVFKVFFLLF